jgi:hypothetical protein
MVSALPASVPSSRKTLARIVTVGHAGGGGRVGHAKQLRDRAQGGADGTAMDVDEIGDQRGEFGMREGRTDDSGGAVVQRRHGVEQVRKTRRASRERSARFLV